VDDFAFEVADALLVLLVLGRREVEAADGGLDVAGGTVSQDSPVAHWDVADAEHLLDLET
jgi:hypothetical protein